MQTETEALPYELARWVSGPEEMVQRITSRSDVILTRDSDDNYVALFREPFYLRYTLEKFPDLKFDTKS